ncbi:MAG TPA: MerR family transcriptional regulator [Gammaproteobacteria bacterium]|nr:MerR family transcriptional regulator [Gammaproteobacteria bacterium]
MTDRRQQWKIGEVAEFLETTTRTLRFYEEQGLLHPRRTERGTRLYSAHDWERASMILRLAALGVPLEEIRDLVNARGQSHTGDEAGHRVHHLLRRLHQEAEAKRAECEAVLAEIDAADRLVRKCYHCPNPPTPQGCPDCPALRGREDAPLLEVVWEEDDPG